jgi:hypothetical protein
MHRSHDLLACSERDMEITGGSEEKGENKNTNKKKKKK